MGKFAILVLLIASFAHAQAPFCDQINSLTEASPAHWGVSVTTLDGTSLCSVNDAKLFRPASNAKLFTSAAALALLGPNKTFETKVTGDLDLATGVVKGDLTLVGGGDANLDSGDLPYTPKPPPHRPLAFPDLDILAAQLAAKGVKTITGDIVGDDTLFLYEPYAFAWELDDLAYGFGAPVSALTLADNQLELTVTPGTATVGAKAGIDQDGLPYYTVVSDMTTIPAGSPDTPGFAIERLPGSRTVRIVGGIRANAQPITTHIAIDDPAAFAAMAFRAVLLQHGIAVTGSSRARHRPVTNGVDFQRRLHDPDQREEITVAGGEAGGNCLSSNEPPVLATHTSAPLGQDLIFTDKTSQNLHAEILLHQLGRRVFCGQGSTVEGARMVRAFLLHTGIAPDDFDLFDGSGLSDRDLVTPRSISHLLVYSAKQTWFPYLKSALPIGGVDGTLESRFAGPLKGKVFAKTGTLGESRALSGFLTAASGQTLVFSILDDNHPPGSNADRTLTDQIVALIAAAN